MNYTSNTSELLLLRHNGVAAAGDDVAETRSSTTTTSTTTSTGSTKYNNVRVVVRIRPLNSKELLHQTHPVLYPKESNDVAIVDDPNHHTSPSPSPPTSSSISSPTNPSSLVPTLVSTTSNVNRPETQNNINTNNMINDDNISVVSTTSTSSCSTNRKRSIFGRFRKKRNINRSNIIVDVPTEVIQDNKKSTLISTTDNTTNPILPDHQDTTSTSTALSSAKCATTTCSGNEQMHASTTTSAEAKAVTTTVCIATSTTSTTTTTTTNHRQYELDRVFGPNITQMEFYQQCIGTDRITNLFHQNHPNTTSTSTSSMNLTILAYGMTGTGKTYTMNRTDGIMYHAVQDLFRIKHTLDNNNNDNNNDNNNNHSSMISIRMSCYEIYADEIRDLLDVDDGIAPKMEPSQSHSPLQKIPRTTTLSTNLKVREQSNENVMIVGLQEMDVTTPDQVYEYIDIAQTRRVTCTTQLNERSSRSHAIYVFHIQQQQQQQHVINNNNNQGKQMIITNNKLTFVDLAGSERVKISGVMGIHQKETIQINQDLFVLGKVISALHEKKLHIPYRDSKLTRILRSSLGGGGGGYNNNCYTILIACVSPAEAHLEESLNTLRYAERARSITNILQEKSNLSTNLSPAQILQLQEENAILRARLTNISRRQATLNCCCNNHSNIIGTERGGIKLSTITTKLQRAKVEAHSIHKHATTHHKNKYEPYKMNPTKNELHQQQQQQLELEKLCTSLRQEVDFLNGENDILRLQTIRLQDEIKRIRIMKGISNEPVSSKDLVEDDDIDLTSHHDKVRLHAEKMLDWANRAIEKHRDSCNNSIASSDGTDLRPMRPVEDYDSCAIFRARNSADSNNENNFSISNINPTTTTATGSKSGKCPCQESVFSKQPEVVDFYLPKLSLVCSCGRKDTVTLVGSDPCLIENILREWQVLFCKSCGFHTAEELLCAYTTNPTQLAKRLRAWRKTNGMLTVKTKSCGIALRIWARTCRTVMKATQHFQNGGGKVLRPDFLDVSLDSDSYTVSTLGFNSSDTEEISLQQPFDVSIPTLSK